MSHDGQAATLLLSDPWELVEAVGASPIVIEIVATHSFADGADVERLLARTCKPIWWADRAYEFVVLESRRGPGITQELESGEPAQCNVIGVSASDVEQGAPWGAPSWRGGLAAIGTLSIA